MKENGIQGCTMWMSMCTLHDVLTLYSSQTLANLVIYVREENNHYKNLFDLVPIQFRNERLWFCNNPPQCKQKHHIPTPCKSIGNQRGAQSSSTGERLDSIMEIFVAIVCKSMTNIAYACATGSILPEGTICVDYAHLHNRSRTSSQGSSNS